MAGEHSILAPSSAARWIACAGSVMLETLYPESEDGKIEAAEGTASHWAGSELQHGQVVAEGQVAPNGIVLTDEMIAGAEVYAHFVLGAFMPLCLPGTELHVEERIEIHDVHALNWGTPDAWFYDAGSRTLEVFDYKFGHGFVDVFENWQLIDYTAGILSALGVNGVEDQATRVNMHVIQPRSYHRDGPIRTWSVVASELRPYFNRLRNAAEVAMQTGATCKPNPECLHCKARHACEALQRDAYRSAQVSTGSLPVDLTPAALGLELHFLRAAAKRLEGRITGLEEQARQQLGQGQRVPFFALESVPGREAWTKPAPEVLALGELFGVSLAKNDMLTPNQARDLFKRKGVPADVLGAYSTRGSALKLMPDDGTQARKVFAK